nr:germin-like protein subfamily T member 2 [Coffea arabica]
MPSYHCVDPPPLQDYCIANLSSNMNLNGYPCKNPSDSWNIHDSSGAAQRRRHTPPRASEPVVCTKGRILEGFVTTDSAFLYKILKPKMVFVIPQAMLHMVINVGKGNALLYAKLQQSKSRSLFNSTPSVPDAALSKSFRANDSIVEFIKSNINVPLIPS